jgi:hypothetical protein
MYPVDVRGKPVHDSIPDSRCRFVEDGSDDCIQRLALNQRDQGAPMPLADHGIALPVAEAPPAIDNGRAFIDRDLVGGVLCRNAAAAPDDGPAEAGTPSGHDFCAAPG